MEKERSNLSTSAPRSITESFRTDKSLSESYLPWALSIVVAWILSYFHQNSKYTQTYWLCLIHFLFILFGLKPWGLLYHLFPSFYSSIVSRHDLAMPRVSKKVCVQEPEIINVFVCFRSISKYEYYTYSYYIIREHEMQSFHFSCIFLREIIYVIRFLSLPLSTCGECGRYATAAHALKSANTSASNAVDAVFFFSIYEHTFFFFVVILAYWKHITQTHTSISYASELICMSLTWKFIADGNWKCLRIQCIIHRIEYNILSGGCLANARHIALFIQVIDRIYAVGWREQTIHAGCSEVLMLHVYICAIKQYIILSNMPICATITDVDTFALNINGH